MLLHTGPLQNFDVNTLEEQLVKRDRRRIYIAFGAAVLLHASTVVGFTFWTPPEPVAPPGDMVITIDLAPAMMSAEATGPAGIAESAPQPEIIEDPEPTEEPEIQEPEPVVEPTPEPVEEPQEVVEQPPAEAPAEAEIETPPPPAEEPVVAVAPKKEKPKKPKPKPKPKPKASSEPRAASTSQSRQRAEVSGSGAQASPTEINKYAGRVRSAIERRKRTPSGAAGIKGVVYVSFVINKSGGITGLRLSRSSGNAALDAAARQSVMEASIPPIPDGLPATMPFGVPIRFN